MAAGKRKKPRVVMSVPDEADHDEDFPSVDEADETPLTDNAYDVPLFADSDRRSLRSVASLRIFKFEHGGMVYRGQVPPTTTLEDIGEQFGDGRYAIEACNVKHRVLDRKENVRIALGNRGASITGVNSTPFDHAADLDRVERLASSATQQAVEQSRTFTTMVTEHSATASQRERDFMSSMLAQQSQGFQQMMALLQTSHNHTLQRLEAMTAGSGENQINPVQMMQLMMQAIRTGAEMSGGTGDVDDDTPPWLQILGGGADLLLNTAKRKFSGNALPADTNTPPVSNPKRMTDAQKTLVKEALQLSSAIAASGLTVPEALEKIKSQPVVPSAPERPRPADTGSEEDDVDDVFPEDESDDDESESDDSDIEEPTGTGESDSASDTG